MKIKCSATFFIVGYLVGYLDIISSQVHKLRIVISRSIAHANQH